MKRIITSSLFLIFSFLVSSLYAQVEEKEQLMSLGDQNALIMDVKNVDKKKLEGYFKTYFKEYGKVKYNRKAKEFYISGAKMPTISKDKVNVYAKMEELNNSARVSLFLDNGQAFVSSSENADQYKSLEKIMVDFDIYVEKLLIEKELKEAEKNLTQMERKEKQLKKDNEKYHKTIEEARKKIAKMEEAIAQNVKDQDDKAKEIEIHKQAIEEIREKLNNVGKNKKVKM